MKTFKYIKIAKSLCAVILAVGVLFFALQPKAFAEETTADSTEQADTGDSSIYDPDTKTQYKYYIEIEFGPMQFYYDWGKWDPETYTYKANDTSVDPAQDTTLGTPGWYGFDGTSNKISIINKAEDPGGYPIDVSIEFTNTGTLTGTDVTDDTDANLLLPLVENCITMSCYTAKDWTRQDLTTIGEVYLVTADTNEQIDLYLSFSGVPMTNSEGKKEKFHSAVMQQVGFITVTVSAHESDPAMITEESAIETTTEETTTEATMTEETTTEETTTAATTENIPTE